MSTTDGWLKLNFASCVIRKTRSLGALFICMKFGKTWRPISKKKAVGYVRTEIHQRKKRSDVFVWRSRMYIGNTTSCSSTERPSPAATSNHAAFSFGFSYRSRVRAFLIVLVCLQHAWFDLMRWWHIMHLVTYNSPSRIHLYRGFPFSPWLGFLLARNVIEWSTPKLMQYILTVVHQYMIRRVHKCETTSSRYNIQQCNKRS